MKFFSAYRGLRKEIYILFFSKIVTCVGSMVWTMMTFILSDKLGMSATEISIWFTFNSIALIPAQLIGGKIADKFNKKYVIYICDIIEVFLYMYCFLVPLSKTSIIVFLACSCLENISSTSYGSLVADLSSSKDRDNANSLLYFGTNLGMMISPVLAGFLVREHANLLFLINGVATFVAVLLEVIFLKDTTPEENVSEYEKSQDSCSTLEIIKNNLPVMVFCVIVSFQWVVYSEYSFFVPLDLSRVYGDDGSVVYGFLSTINCITVVLFTAYLTKITDKMKELNKYILALLFFAAGYILFATFTENKIVCYVSFFVFTIGEIFATIVCDPFISRRVPSSHRGRIFSIYGVIGAILYAAFQKPLATIYDSHGSRTAWSIVLLIIGILIASILILKKFDEKRYSKIYETGYLDDDEKS